MSVANESKLTMKLAFPLIIGQVSQMLLGVADTMMIGQLGVIELAVLTFANSLFYLPFIFGIGVLTSVSVFTSGSVGSGDTQSAQASCRNGFLISTALGIGLCLVLWGVSFRLDLFGQPPEVVALTGNYFRIIMVSMIPALMSLALKNHADALDRPWPPFWIFLSGVLLNVVLNWIMIYGNLGCPAMGLEGGAIATLIARVGIVVGMFVWLYGDRGLRKWVPKIWFKRPEPPEIRKFLSVGFPASIQMLCEVSAFSAAGLMMGYFGATAMAAHQVALTCAATAFMIPLGLSMALSVRVGQARGAGEFSRLRVIAVSGWWLSAGYALVGALFFLLCGNWISSLFTDVKEVIQLSATILVVVGFFQLVDSVQIASVAMLRAMHDTRMPALIGFFAYWLIGLPVAALLSMKCDLGALGVWCGLALGLLLACVLLSPRLWRMTVLNQPALKVDSKTNHAQLCHMDQILTLLNKVLEEFDCQTGTLHRAKDNFLHLVGQIGVPDFLMEKIRLIPFGKGIAGVAAEKKEPVELCNLQLDLGGVAKEDARKTGVSGSLAIPILAHSGEVLGTIGIGKLTPYDFNSQEKARLTELGHGFVEWL